MSFPSREDTLTGFPQPSPLERLAVLEVNVHHVGADVRELKDQVTSLDNKMDSLILELARGRKKSSTPPNGTSSMSPMVKNSIVATVTAVIVSVIQALVTPSSPPPPHTAQTSQKPVEHAGP